MDTLRSLDAQFYRILALSLLTGLTHLFLGARLGDGLFILNGLGFIALVIGLYLLPQLAKWSAPLRWGLMAYAAVTVAAYFLRNPDPFNSGLGLITKAIEVVLIVLLYLQQRQHHAH